jgi:proline iminopeptidase
MTTNKTVRVDDIDIACTLVGDGVPVIVLHGAIGLGSTYVRALDPWGDELTLIHYDQRGSGQTPLGDPGKVTFAGALGDLEGLRRELDLDEVVVLGHSAGAYLAALYAATYPDRTRGAVLLNAGPPLHPELMARFQAEMSARRTAADNDARVAIEESTDYRAGDPLALERHQLNTFIPFFRDRSTVDRVSLGFTEITAANVQAAPGRMTGSLPSLDPMRRFAAIRCPTLVVHGELDPIPVEWSEALADTVPGADLGLLEGAGHFPMIEDPGALRDAVMPWILKHAS